MRSVWLVSLLLVLEIAGLTLGLLQLVLKVHAWIPDNLQSPIGCILFGGIGGCVYCLRAVYVNACVKKNWDKDWLPWYVIRPFVSMVIGGISFLFIATGLLLLGDSSRFGTNQLGAWTVAFLAGLNVSNFMVKLEDVGATLLGLKPSRQSQKETPTISKEQGNG